MHAHLPEEVTKQVRSAYDEFASELDHLGYSPNARATYDKTIERFIRWLEGAWEPAGPRTNPPEAAPGR